MSRLFRALHVTAMVAVITAPAVARAQAGVWELLGIVRNEDGTVVEGATVAIQGQSVRTDRMGLFRLQADRRDTITLAIRRIGYNPISTLLTSTELTGDTLLIVMEPSSQQLDAVNIRARDLRSQLGFGSFEERRSLGIGEFITQADIEKRNNSRLSDHFRNKRGVIVRSASGVRSGSVMFTGCTSRRRAGESAAPAIFLDGQHMKGMEVDEIPVNTVAGVEIYSSIATTPAQFTTGQVDRPCGTIVIWTKEPGKR